MDVTLKTRDQGDVPGVEYTMGKEEDILRGDELIIKNVKTNKVFSTASTSGKFRSPSSFYFPVYVPSKRIVPEEASPTRNTNGWSA